MPSISTQVGVQRKAKDGWYVYTSPQLPGLYVASKDDHKAYSDVLLSIKQLMKLDHGWDVEVRHTVPCACRRRRSWQPSFRPWPHGYASP